MSQKAIIIPCYNESDRIQTELFLSFLNTNSEYTLFFVDDGSNDNTLKTLNDIKEKNPNQVRVIKNETNKGKAESVRRGILEAFKENSYEYISFLDADLSTPLEEIVKMTAQAITNNKKAVFGSRLKTLGTEIDRRISRHFIGRIVATFIDWIIELPFYDTQCGAKVFHKNVIETCFNEPFITKWLFDVEIIMRLKNKMGSAISQELSEYPLDVWKDVKGSKLTIHDSYKTPIDLIRIRLKYKNQ